VRKKAQNINASIRKEMEITARGEEEAESFPEG
jgi:hypothetical protein